MLRMSFCTMAASFTAGAAGCSCCGAGANGMYRRGALEPEPAGAACGPVPVSATAAAGVVEAPRKGSYRGAAGREAAKKWGGCGGGGGTAAGVVVVAAVAAAAAAAAAW